MRNLGLRPSLRPTPALFMVARMLRTVRIAAAAAILLNLAACGRSAPAAQAAPEAQSLLAAVWTGDSEAFEAGLDRAALRADLRQRLLQVAQANSLAIEGGASDAALDRMISPSAFKLVAAGTGAPLSEAPTRAQTAAMMRDLGKDRACLHDLTPEQGCVLTFARQAGHWRLVAMPPAGFDLQVAPEPEKTRS
jgi:hypothetical protein